MLRIGLVVIAALLFFVAPALARLAEATGAELRTGEPVERVERGRVFAGGSVYEADFVVSDLDANRLDALLPSRRVSVPKKLTPRALTSTACCGSHCRKGDHCGLGKDLNKEDHP